MSFSLFLLSYDCQYGDSYGVVNYNVGTKLNARVVRSLFAAEVEIQEGEQETKKMLRAKAKDVADAPENDLDDEVSSIISESNSRKYNSLPNDWYPKIAPSCGELVENCEQMKIRKRAMEGDPEALSYYPSGYWDPYIALQRAIQKKLEEEKTYESYRKLLSAGFKDVPLVDDINANQIGEDEPYIERNYGGIETKQNVAGIKVPKMDKATVESKKESVIERQKGIEIGQVGEERKEKEKEKEKENENANEKKEKKKKKRLFCCC
ncbi:Plasmodium exported protein, unknown function [Plasmodium ovale wallikeri]|uniref:Uncharacterized protein n=1 Tax=Plasmodium ovale wallikeri TaxID=864142 RepID=A0A1A9ARN0_PLAOA|nr:Plasmodium exported protein, unknown function [Plasmodium ovale wallikeri]SBT59368.1 Plasmodium exported protein, unknown function [Plasmodium ovale wallikeri]